jgi:hypothetical protein
MQRTFLYRDEERSSEAAMGGEGTRSGPFSIKIRVRAAHRRIERQKSTSIRASNFSSKMLRKYIKTEQFMAVLTAFSKDRILFTEK